MSSANPTKRWRRWLRFSLRTLLVVMALIAVVFGFVMKQAREQRLAVAAILESGGRVLYDFQPDDSEHVRGRLDRAQAESRRGPARHIYIDDPWEPRWLLDIVGLDCFHRVKQVSLRGPGAKDSTMEQVSRLSGVKRLGLYSTSITDAGLANIDNLNDLEYFEIDRCLITDAGLAHVGRLPNLMRLELSYVDVTDEGLRHLEGLRNVEALVFAFTQVTKDAAEELRRKLPNCRPVAVYP
jgi:hypothetical protein